MQAKEAMTQPVITVSSQDSILEAVRLKLENKISGLPVVDESENLTGILTEGDFLRQRETDTLRRRPALDRVPCRPRQVDGGIRPCERAPGGRGHDDRGLFRFGGHSSRGGRHHHGTASHQAGTRRVRKTGGRHRHTCQSFVRFDECGEAISVDIDR